MIDQAAELRKLVLRASRRPGDDRQPAPRLVVLMGGKGGVGVTTLAVNLAVALAARRYRVVLVDADPFRADVALLCAVPERHDMGDVLSGKAALTDVLQPGPGGISVVPGIWAPDRQTALDNRRGQRLLTQIRRLGAVADVVLLDAGSAGSDIVDYLRPAMSAAVLVTTPDAVAIMDCYATIKTVLCNTAAPASTSDVAMISERRDIAAGSAFGVRGPSVGLITNQVETPAQGRDVHSRIDQSTRRFLRTEVSDLGAVPHDPALPRTATDGMPLILHDPGAPAARAIEKIAARLATRWGPVACPPRAATA